MSVFGSVLLMFSLIPLLGGAFAAYLGWKRRTTSTAISETGTTPVSDLEPGRVGVTGRVRSVPSASTVRSPISRDTAVAYGVTVEKYESGGGGDDGGGGGWERIHTEWESVPFLLTSGEETVAVDPPAGADQRYNWIQATVNPGEDPPSEVQSFVERTAQVDESGGRSLGPLALGSPRRYSEGMLEPDEQAYVLGRARETEASHEAPDYIIDESAAGQFILSDRPPDELMKEDKWMGRLYLAVGVLSVAFGIFFIFLILVLFFL